MKKYSHFFLKTFSFLTGVRSADMMRYFLWSFFGVIVNSGVIFGLNIFVGRTLGPEEYGKLNFVLAIGYILVIFMVGGQDSAVVRYVSKNAGSENLQKAYVFNSFVITFVSSLITILVFFVILGLLKNVLDEPSLWIVSVVYAFALSLKMVLDGVYRGFHRFREQAKGRIIETGVVVLVFFGLLLFFRGGSYVGYIAALCAGYLFFLFFSFPIFGNLRMQWRDFWRMKEMLPYSFTVVWGSFISLLSISVDKIIIGKYMGMEILGTYSAYITVSVVLIMQMTNAISNVFFPLVNVKKNMREVMQKIDIFSLFACVPVMFALTIISAVILKVFGNQYEFSWTYLILFGIAGMAQFLGSFYRNLAMTERKLFQKSQRLALTILVLFIVVLISLVKGGKDALSYIVFSYMVYSVVLFFAIRENCRIFLKN